MKWCERGRLYENNVVILELYDIDSLDMMPGSTDDEMLYNILFNANAEFRDYIRTYQEKFFGKIDTPKKLEIPACCEGKIDVLKIEDRNFIESLHPPIDYKIIAAMVDKDAKKWKYQDCLVDEYDNEVEKWVEAHDGQAAVLFLMIDNPKGYKVKTKKSLLLQLWGEVDYTGKMDVENYYFFSPVDGEITRHSVMGDLRNLINHKPKDIEGNILELLKTYNLLGDEKRIQELRLLLTSVVNLKVDKVRSLSEYIFKYLMLEVYQKEAMSPEKYLVYVQELTEKLPREVGLAMLKYYEENSGHEVFQVKKLHRAVESEEGNEFIEYIAVPEKYEEMRFDLICRKDPDYFTYSMIGNALGF